MSSELGLPQSRIAAIGDSSGDFDMLNVAGEPIFVGTSTAQCAGSWRHMPNANISEIAEYLIERWQLKPNERTHAVGRGQSRAADTNARNSS